MMKWYDVRLWKLVIICLFVGLILTSFLSCGTQKTVTKQTYLKDELNEKKFDSLFMDRMAYSFEQWLLYQKQENDKSVKDSSYVKDSTATRFDAQGNKIGEDRFHYESYIRTEKDIQKLLDSISHYSLLKDSVAIYRHRLDSLSSIKRSSKIAVRTVEKQLTTAQKIYIQIGQLFCFCLVIVILYLLYVLRKRYS